MTEFCILDGIAEFLNFASSQLQYMDGNKIRCPCRKCMNKKFFTVGEVQYHLITKGFVENYYVWNRHGEEELPSPIHSGQ
ncbi:hypothetical protein JQN44_27310, partial [Klebsiella pneumoniae]|nr:hypothetical protein [Klebsiella pneumoniae]